MKKQFIPFLLTCSMLILCANANAQLGEVVTDSLGEKVLLRPAGWTIEPNADFPLVLSENFQNWTLNHDKANNDVASKGRAAATSYADWQQTVQLLGPLEGQNGQISMIKCAAAPEGLSQNKIEFTPKNDPDDGKYQGNQVKYEGANGAIADPENGAPLSVGFLEVSRWNSNGTNADGANLASTAYNGSVTLPAIPGALVVQYAYSSIGGAKRALKLERSTDGGNTWEIIRNPIKDVVQNNGSYTGYALRDSAAADVMYPLGADAVETAQKPYTSAYHTSGAGVYVEDFIGTGEETVTLRFTINDCWATPIARDTAHVKEANGHAETQDYRLHEIRVIAVPSETGVNTAKADAFLLIPTSQYVKSSEIADIQIYDVNGRVVREVKQSYYIYNEGLASGIYIVKATVLGKGTVVKKFSRR